MTGKSQTTGAGDKNGEGSGWSPPPPQYMSTDKVLPPPAIPRIVVLADVIWLTLCCVAGLGAVIWHLVDPAPQSISIALIGCGLLSLAGSLGWFLKAGRQRYRS